MLTDFEKVRDLFDVYGEHFGVPFSEIETCQNRLNLALPNVLTQFYLQFGKHDAIIQTQNKLLSPDELYIHKSGYLIFYQENQCVYWWGIPVSDLIQDNPMVYYTKDRQLWQVEQSLPTFLTASAYFQALFALPFSANALAINTKSEEYIRKKWKNTGVVLHAWHTQFFQNTNDELLALIQNNGQNDLFVATKTKDSLMQIHEKLSLTWDYFSLILS